MLSAETVRDTPAVYSHCVLPLDAVKNMATLTGSALIVVEEILLLVSVYIIWQRAEGRPPNDEHTMITILITQRRMRLGLVRTVISENSISDSENTSTSNTEIKV